MPNWTLGLDLILHTPGGGIAATQSLVDYLQRMFKSDIRAIVPQIAMSAGTILACCCKQILMCKHSNLGPIDPHLNGMPTYGVIREFRRALREVKRDPSRALGFFPARRRRFLGDSLPFSGGEGFRPGLATFESAQPPQRHGSGVLDGFWLGCLPRGLLDDGECNLIRVLRSLTSVA